MALIDKLNAIGDAIRAKTGKSDKLTLDQMPLEIESITGGGATVEDIIPEQELTFVYDESSNVYTLVGHNLFSVTSIALGKEYKVVWGSDEYSCTAVEGLFLGQYPMIGIGNPYVIGGENNNLPFAIGYITIPDDGNSQYSCIIASLDGSTSKKVHVYQEASGGVQDDRVKYVTFIGLGGVELYRQPVIVGDTCRNPVDKNYIETPTKESTVSQVFTYNGWSLAEGGSASSSALTNVTKDRTVYVAFTSTVRQYTITFYDDDGTVLDSKLWNYGSTPSYTPERSGYTFEGWSPEITAVVGDASYVATWSEGLVLESGKCGDNVTYKIYDNGELLLTGEGSTYAYNTSDNLAPWKNSENADTITSITVRDGITYLGRALFYSLANVTSATISDSVTSTGIQIFSTCRKLANVTLSKNITHIADYMFQSAPISWKKVNEILLENSVTSIGVQAFSGVGLGASHLLIPSSVKEIGMSAFGYITTMSIKFEDADGWYVTQTRGASSGTNITAGTDGEMKSNWAKYSSYYWYDAS